MCRINIYDIYGIFKKQQKIIKRNHVFIIYEMSRAIALAPYQCLNTLIVAHCDDPDYLHFPLHFRQVHSFTLLPYT